MIGADVESTAAQGVSTAPGSFGTDCEYVTKCLCEKSLKSEGAFRILGSVKANLALNADAPESGAPVSFSVRQRFI